MDKIRKLYRRKNVYDTIEPFFKVWKCFGLSGFSLKSTVFKSDSMDFLYCLIHIVFGSYITYFVFGRMMSILYSKLLSITVFLVSNYSIFGAIVIFVVNFLTREKNFVMMRKFVEFDNEVKIIVNTYLLIIPNIIKII